MTFNDDGIIICEHSKLEKLSDSIGEFIKYDIRDYIKMYLFYKKE